MLATHYHFPMSKLCQQLASSHAILTQTLSTLDGLDSTSEFNPAYKSLRRPFAGTRMVLECMARCMLTRSCACSSRLETCLEEVCRFACVQNKWGALSFLRKETCASSYHRSSQIFQESFVIQGEAAFCEAPAWSSNDHIHIRILQMMISGTPFCMNQDVKSSRFSCRLVHSCGLVAHEPPEQRGHQRPSDGAGNAKPRLGPDSAGTVGGAINIQ